MIKRKICVITGSRAEYGLLKSLMSLIKSDADLILQLIVTNMHLSPEFGLTYKEIENDGFNIDKKVEMLLSSDSQNATTKSVGLATIGFADAYEDLKPNLIVVLGDRFEILAAVTAALFFKIPVAHLHGGEITEGAYDDSIRHAITKMSHLHLTSTESYRKRVIQLGEEPDRVFNVGAIGVENIYKTSLLNKKILEESLNFVIGEKCFLITFHPVTLDSISSETQFQNLLNALDKFKDYKLIFTYPNSDTDGRVIIKMIEEYVSKNKERSIAFSSLGQQRYFSALQFVTAVIGNSSSGIIEVPSFKIPTLNIGDRQKGRIAADSVVNCGIRKSDIIDGINIITSEKTLKQVKSLLNPYEKSETANTIMKHIKENCSINLINKSFYDFN